MPGSKYGTCVPNLDPTGKYCTTGKGKPKPILRCSAGEKCLEIPGSEYGLCIPDLDPTGVYCVEDNQCRFDEKCGASGNTNHGYRVPELDPTGKYCAGSSDCRWYLLEKCVNGECQKIIDRSTYH